MAQGKNVIITGATGMIGSIVLDKCLADSSVRMVTYLGRNSTGKRHDKLREVIHDDFENFISIEHYFRDQDVAYYCLGVYTGQVNNEEFRKITVDYTVKFAKALKRESPQVKFCFLSGRGADPLGKSRIPFARFKGKAENELVKMNFPALYIFRPGYIYPVEKRDEPNIGYTIMRLAYPLLKKVLPKASVTSEQLADVMFATGNSDSKDIRVFENADILQIVS